MLLYLPLFFYSQLSLAVLLSFIKIYTLNSSLFLLLFLILSGLPPVSFFFLKFNILIYILPYFTSYFTFFIFFIFFFNMLFYLNIFKYKKIWLKLPQLFSHKNIAISSKGNLLRNNMVFNKYFFIEFSFSYIFYNSLFLLYGIFFFLIFNFFFFTDIYLILHNLHL